MDVYLVCSRPVWRAGPNTTSAQPPTLWLRSEAADLPSRWHNFAKIISCHKMLKFWITFNFHFNKIFLTTFPSKCVCRMSPASHPCLPVPVLPEKRLCKHDGVEQDRSRSRSMVTQLRYREMARERASDDFSSHDCNPSQDILDTHQYQLKVFLLPCKLQQAEIKKKWSL